MKSIDDIYNLSLQLLKIAESNFGEQITGWEYKGIIVEDNGPYLEYYPDQHHIYIVLSNRVIEDDIQLIWQLSHEVCHLLYPSIDCELKKRTIYLNEGISTYFQVDITSQFTDKEKLIQNLENYSQKYFDAYNLIVTLLEIDNDFIFKLRKIEPMIDNVTRENILSINNSISDYLVSKLLNEF
jgi:hypothetical protein